MSLPFHFPAYRLEGTTLVRLENLPIDWFDRYWRRVDETRVNETTRVSTVFLALDHSFGQGPPLVFETMVFGGPLHQEQDRYATWDEAVSGHAAMVARVISAERVLRDVNEKENDNASDRDAGGGALDGGVRNVDAVRDDDEGRGGHRGA